MTESRRLHKAKRIDNEKWVEGYYKYALFKGSCISNSITEHHYIFDPNNKASLKNHDIEFEIYPKTLCQCTGRKDKKDMLVYENDVCYLGNKKGVIVWFDGKWALQFKPYSYDTMFEFNDLDVIGNTKDLLIDFKFGDIKL